jgi:tRNA pseudouridine13 synthase
MKIKQKPDDFRVEELATVSPGPTGRFSLYRLNKVGWTTPDALAVVRRRWEVDLRRLSYGGLKDRHADTTQYFTIQAGPRTGFQEQRIQVNYLGQVAEPFTAQQIVVNRFTITVRHLTPDQQRRAAAGVEEIAAVGVPNYFDDQRFGSVSSGEFVGRELVHGRFEAALRLALTGAYDFDRRDQKREKETLRTLWGDWPQLKAKLGRSHARSLVDYLVTHPTDFKGAVARLRPELQGLYLSAYQSDLWNRILDRWIRTHFPANALTALKLKLGPLSAPVRLPDDLADRWTNTRLPLPSARLKPPADADWLPLVEQVLAEEGLTLTKLKVPGLDRPFFSKGERAVSVRPVELTAEAGDDELNRGRRKLVLRFDLPRGSYATMLIKRVISGF